MTAGRGVSIMGFFGRGPARPLAAAALAAFLGLNGPALAQNPPAQRVRGTVERIDAGALVVKSREGSLVTVKLREGWTIGGLARATLADIKPGSFVGAAALGPANGPLQALEILVFPAGVKSNEGHFGWDLMPESTMTNATVSSTVESVAGPVLTLAYPGGEKTIVVRPDTPIVTFAPAEKSDLKPGAPVFLSAQRADDQSLSTMRITVGNNGVAPPM